jgi:NAD+ kinase
MTSAIRQLGLVVHPTRPVDSALSEIRAWAAERDVKVGQVDVPPESRPVADKVEATDCDLLVAVGGDGTALSALHAGARAARPVLSIACGSLGALTTVSAERSAWALDQVESGSWTRVPVPALAVDWGDEYASVAVNDVAMIRDDPGQIILSITVDDVLYARVAGDGLVVATALGSSAYTIAAGGPILAPGADGMTVTPLAPHGGSCPPLVAGMDSRLEVAIESGRIRVRYELDGRRMPVTGRQLTIRVRPDFATAVGLAQGEPRLTGLRRRGLVLDSPRILARDLRESS